MSKTRQTGGESGRMCVSARHPGRKGKNVGREVTLTSVARMETGKQETFSLLRVTEKERNRKTLNESMTNGIRRTGNMTVARKVPGSQHSTILYSGHMWERMSRDCSEAVTVQCAESHLAMSRYMYVCTVRSQPKVSGEL